MRADPTTTTDRSTATSVLVAPSEEPEGESVASDLGHQQKRTLDLDFFADPSRDPCRGGPLPGRGGAPPPLRRREGLVAPMADPPAATGTLREQVAAAAAAQLGALDPAQLNANLERLASRLGEWEPSGRQSLASLALAMLLAVRTRGGAGKGGGRRTC